MRPRGNRWSRRRIASFLGVTAGLTLTLPPAILAQGISTVREVQFRSRWADYQVDRPREEPATIETPDGPVQKPVPKTLRSLFRTGPVDLRASVGVGWEYSNERLQVPGTENTSESSFFLAPALAAFYEREIGPWNLSLRYSLGYVFYLDQEYVAAGDSGGIQSQTAGLDILRQGSRLQVRSSTGATFGSGYDIERRQQTDRLTLNETGSLQYPLSEFIVAGGTLRGSYQSYEAQNGGSSDELRTFGGTVYGDYVWTGKTRFRLELGAGQDSQRIANDQAGLDRSYTQALVRVFYEPTGKLKVDAGVGLGVVDESGLGSRAQDGLRTVYSLGVDYAPTTKTSARLYVGVEAASLKPEFTLSVAWNPREATSVALSVYQQTNLSTLLVSQDRTARGVQGSIHQRIFQKVNLGLNAGYEKEEYEFAGSTFGPASDPYYLVGATFEWEINRWLSWQAQFHTTSRQEFVQEGNNQAQTRGSVSLRLTY